MTVGWKVVAAYSDDCDPHDWRSGTCLDQLVWPAIAWINWYCRVLHGMDQQAGCSTMTMLEGFVFQLLTEKHVMKMASNLRPIVRIICGGC